MARKTYLKVRCYRQGHIVGWLVTNSLDPNFEPHGCHWPHLIRFAPYTTNTGHVITEADAKLSAERYAQGVVRRMPDRYELLA